MFTSKFFKTLFVATLASSFLSLAQAASYRLNTVISSSGSTGSKPIEFHNDLNLGDTLASRMQALEDLRQESITMTGASEIILGVDVNEAASGTEKSETQAVTLERVELVVLMNDGTTYNLTDFSTLTQAMLATGNNGPETRSPYYTLLGSSGSNTITGLVFKDQFDSTLTIAVPEELDFTQAVEATLHIDLLNVNTKLGDPELFYDYSNGFEDLALLNDADARYLDRVAKGIISNGDKLDTQAPLPSGAPMVINLRDGDAPYVEWVSYPSANGYYLVGYEDLFPKLGDYDFNDLTVAYRIEVGLDLNSKVSQLRGEAILVTRGALYSHDWHLRIGIGNGSGEVTTKLYQPTADGYGELIETLISTFKNDSHIDIRGFADTLALFPPPEGCDFTNTECETFLQGPKFIFNVVMDRPIDITSMGDAPFDPYLFVRNTSKEIHLIGLPLAASRTQNGFDASNNQSSGNTTFVDENGFPFAMMLTSEWQPPKESRSMEVSYPDFPNYVESRGVEKKDWYLRPDSTKVHPRDKFVWQW